MNSSQVIYALRWLIRDTFLQAVAGKVFWVTLFVTVLCVIFCLGISIEGGESLKEEGELYSPKSKQVLTGPNPEPGTMYLLFGAMPVKLHRDAAAEVHLIDVYLGVGVAGTIGLLLTLAWTAGFLPEFLQPAAASVLLAKPLPRWLFLFGKFLGVCLFVALQSALFFGGTWLALGMRTGVWPLAYLAGCPLFVTQFAMFYSFSVLLAVTTRSAVACILGVILFWALCMGMNLGRERVLALPKLAPGAELPAATTNLTNLAYWILPKPGDMLVMLEDSGAGSEGSLLSSTLEYQEAKRLGAYDPLLSILSSAIFCLVILAIAAYQLAQTDY